MGVCRARETDTVMRSARFFGSSEPIRPSMPSARAPRIVAISRTVRALSADGIHGLVLVEQRRHAHRLEHVQIVVACRSVGPETDRDTGPQVGWNRRRPARRLHVAFRIVRDADAARPERSECRHPTPRCRARPPRRRRGSRDLRGMRPATPPGAPARPWSRRSTPPCGSASARCDASTVLARP